MWMPNGTENESHSGTCVSGSPAARKSKPNNQPCRPSSSRFALTASSGSSSNSTQSACLAATAAAFGTSAASSLPKLASTFARSSLNSATIGSIASRMRFPTVTKPGTLCRERAGFRSPPTHWPASASFVCLIVGLFTGFVTPRSDTPTAGGVFTGSTASASTYACAMAWHKA